MISKKDISEIAEEAYTYFYPLILMDVTRRVSTNVPSGTMPGFGPSNMFHHMRSFPDAAFKMVVRPNFDTLYSIAWLDLTKGPMVISVPDTKGRYYLLEILDTWTDVIAAPGKRTTGTGAGSWAVVPLGWQGTLPEGVGRIDASTLHLWIIGRTQTNGTKDYEAVQAIQDGYIITPLSHWGKKAKQVEFTPDPSVDMETPPMEQVSSMPAKDYFTYAAELTKVNPPHLTDWSQIQRLKQIGIEPGKSFDYDKLDPSIRQALDVAPDHGLKRMEEDLPTIARITNGWSISAENMGVYGNNYLKRAIVAMAGLGANEPEDAIYPMALVDEEDEPFEGRNTYVWHFEKNELPPNKAFWSLTMYDAEGFPAPNPIDRFAIGDRDNLKYNDDGSLDIYIRHTSPGTEEESNWLPSPEGPLGITMRIYWPELQALDGRWNPPPIRQA